MPRVQYEKEAEVEAGSAPTFHAQNQPKQTTEPKTTKSAQDPTAADRQLEHTPASTPEDRPTTAEQPASTTIAQKAFVLSTV